MRHVEKVRERQFKTLKNQNIFCTDFDSPVTDFDSPATDFDGISRMTEGSSRNGSFCLQVLFKLP